MLIFHLRILILSNLILFAMLASPITSWSQTDTSKTARTKPVTPLTNFIKYSNATVKNNLYYPGKVNGFLNENSIFVKDFESQETFSFETVNYDSIQFYYDLPYSYVDKFFIPVLENEQFDYTINPIREISNFNMSVDNSELRKLVNEKLYEVEIKDDVDPNNILVEATEESAKFIDIWKIDSLSVVYQIRLKDKNEIVRNLSEDEIRKWKKGDELSFPIGITLSDKNVPDDVQKYKLFLKKEKKLRKRSN
ncbi:MAG: hypothetical protein SGI89_00085 [bacterium]|nr:hypothetical protein [bacterium]